MSMFKRKRKGEAVLFAIVALAVSGLIAVGLARIQHYGTHTLDTSEEFLKAEQYALEVTEQLRSTSYSAVAAMPKTKISSGTAGSKPGDYKFSGYYKEIVIQNDGIFKDCKVNIYKDDTDRPVLSLSVAKVDPKALVWGGLSDNLDESTESGGNRSWSAQTTQNYVGGKLINDYTAVDADGSFSAAASVDYINNKLKDYIEEEKCLNRTTKAEVGSNRQPIFVNASREAAVCNVSYRLNENTAAPNIGILRKDSAGNITLDYWDHDSYFNGNNTSGTTTPDTGSGGGNAGTNINGSVTLPDEEKLISSKDYELEWSEDKKYLLIDDTVSFTVPDGVKVVKIELWAGALSDTNHGSEPSSDILLPEYDNISLSANCPSQSGAFESYHKEWYMDVSASKNIKLVVQGELNKGGREQESTSGIKIYYSKSINERIPDVTYKN